VEESSHVPSLEKADALATGLWNVPLLIKVADCQPVLVSDMQARAIAAFHVGWRANRGGFLQKWIREFCEHYNLTPEELMVVRGPSLGPAHCEFINFATEWGEGFHAYYDPSSQNVNLWQLTRDQLIEAKIPQEHIFSLDLCTYSCDFHFFSYRRDHITGRQGGIIWKRDEDKG
jgi:copper oxidase (laccase) domain-containing protein